MKCPECKRETMFIDTWNGWRWTCALCDYAGDEAEEGEIEEDESS